MNADKLSKILEKHKKWLNGEEGGERADLYDANLYDANLSDANLHGADLYDANLSDANLYDANLSDANLHGADLSGADLSGANLSGANLHGADLHGADLRGANLSGADLDFSCMPLWCGGLDMHIDDKQAVQLLYHLVRNVQFSKNTSETLKAAILTHDLIDLANKFHRVKDCGEIEKEPTR